MPLDYELAVYTWNILFSQVDTTPNINLQIKDAAQLVNSLSLQFYAPWGGGGCISSSFWLDVVHYTTPNINLQIENAAQLVNSPLLPLYALW